MQVDSVSCGRFAFCFFWVASCLGSQGFCNAPQSNDEQVPTIGQLCDFWESARTLRPIKVEMTQSGTGWEHKRTLAYTGKFGMVNDAIPNGRQIIAWNEDYWFELRSSVSKPSTWSLEGLGPMPLSEKVQQYRDWYLVPDLEEGIRICRYPLKEFFTHPAVTINSIQHVDENSDLIEISFVVDRTKLTGSTHLPTMNAHSGSLRLSAASGYSVIVALQMKVNGGSASEELSGYKFEDSTTTLPTKVEQFDESGKLVFNQVSELSFKPVDPNEFRLPAFGLREPDLPSTSRFPWKKIVWPIAAALIIISIIVFRRLKNR